MCGTKEATVNRGLPVCAGCSEGLDETEKVLDELEASDPKLKAAGDKLRDLEAYLRGDLSTHGIRERSLRRMRKARMKWRSH